MKQMTRSFIAVLVMVLFVPKIFALARNGSAPSSGLYFMHNGSNYYNNDSLNISLVGSQPTDRIDPGSTLVCVTANVNTACCRAGDNNGETNATAGAVGEWHYPNGTTVPRGNSNNSHLGFRRYGYTSHLRLSAFNGSVSNPQGLYHCKVPNLKHGGMDEAYIHLILDTLSMMVSTRPDALTVSTTRSDIRTLSMTVSTKPDTPSLNLLNVAVAACILLLIILIVVILLSCLWYFKCRSKKKHYSPNFNGSSPLALHSEAIELKEKVTVEECSGSAHEEIKGEWHSIAVGDFVEQVDARHKDSDEFYAEYESLKTDSINTFKIAKLSQNIAKNRFGNIFPYDFSRVILSTCNNEDRSDYINASYINGYKRPSCYIAAQGPLPNTESDFWCMIWELKLTHIVMLTNCMECGRRKCEQYWAEGIGDVYKTHGNNILVTTLSVTSFANFVIRTFTLRQVTSNDKELKVTQYHFTSWPDYGVPKDSYFLLSFIKRIQRDHNKELGVPLLVHCSAGVGRTGTFITVDAMLEKIYSEDSVNVYEFVKEMRQRRVSMVQTPAQYVFIHDALRDFIIGGDTEIKSTCLLSKIKYLNENIPAMNYSRFYEQFQLLNEQTQKYKETDCSDATESFNCEKNRYSDRLPFNKSRPYLGNTGEEGSDYINASIVDGYEQRNAYIVTQGPLPHTVNDLWRMIWEFKSKIVVTLCTTVEREKEVCHQFWPQSEEKANVHGKVTVSLQSSVTYEHFEVRKLLIEYETGAKLTNNNSFILTQYHHTSWPEDGNPSTYGVIEMLELITKAQMSAGNKLITVMCNDGVGRSGTFLCIHSQLERLKTEGVVDVFQAVKSARRQRANLVPEEFQYAYTHQVLADYVENFNNCYANFK